jgi:hypothetical protein
VKTASITKKWDIFLCVLFGFLFTACHHYFSSKSDRMQRYEPIISTAKANTEDQAEQNALVILKEQVQERLKRSSKKVLALAMELVRRNVHMSVACSSSGKNRCVATAQVDMKSVIDDQVDQTLKEYHLYLQQLDKAEKLLVDGSDGYGALNLTLASFYNLSEIEKKMEMIKAFDPQRQLFVVTPTGDELAQHILDWISNLEIKTTFGNNQHIPQGQALAMPIGLWIRWVHNGKTVALAGLPVRFFLAGMEEKPLVTDKTNALGIASANISYLPQPGARLLAGIDGRRILSEANFPPDNRNFSNIQKRLEAIQSPFQWHIQEANVLRVILVINEIMTNQIQAFDQSESVKELVNILEDEGFYLQVSHELSDANQLYTPQQLATYFKDRADFIIVGQVESEVERAVAEGLVFALTKGKIQVVNVLTSSVVATFEDLSNGAGQDAYSAQLRSIVNFAQKAKTTLLKTLKVPNPAAP